LHSIIARWFWQRVRYTFGDPQISEAMDSGLFVEPCIYAANTAVVRYPVQDSILSSHPADLIQQVDELALDTQLAVLAFVTEFFTSGLDGNAVSFTANLDPSVYSEASTLMPVISKWISQVKGLTVFPSMSRPQSPYEPITQAEYLAAATGTALFGSSNDGECAGGACPVR
jgi:hypothetical protein